MHRCALILLSQSEEFLIECLPHLAVTASVPVQGGQDVFNLFDISEKVFVESACPSACLSASD